MKYSNTWLHGIFKENDHSNILNFINNKKTNIFILRFIAALFVIIFHSRPSEYTKGGVLFIETLTTPCVDIFIICTALLSFDKKTNHWRKYLDFIITFYIVNFLYELPDIIHSDINYKSLLVPMFWANGGFWYLKTYFFFYPLIPLLNKAINSKRDVGYFMIYFVFSLIAAHVLSKSGWGENILYMTNLLLFVNVYSFTRSLLIVINLNYKVWPLLITYILSFGIVFVTRWFYVNLEFPRNWHSYTIFLAVQFSFIIMWFDFKKNWLSMFFADLGSMSLYYYVFDDIYRVNIRNYIVNMFSITDPIRVNVASISIQIFLSTIIASIILWTRRLISKKLKCKYTTNLMFI